MKYPFTKMQGAGNDFVLFDNRGNDLHLTEVDIRKICDRRFGIGADGILLLDSPPGDDHDARMVYYNADGSRGEMCGNGARCFAAFALSQKLGENGTVRFLTDAGPITAQSDGDEFTIQMTPPQDLELNIEIALKEGPATVHYVNTGVPHVVRFLDILSDLPIRDKGAELRYHTRFAPKGANADFARVAPGEPVQIRTYERGVEDETLACGTGVTATAIIAHLVHGLPEPVRIRVAGGDVLSVGFRHESGAFHDVTLSGPAKTVFEGAVELPPG